MIVKGSLRNQTAFLLLSNVEWIYHGSSNHIFIAMIF